MDEEKLSRRKNAQKKNSRSWWKKFRRKHDSTQDADQPEDAEKQQQGTEETMPHLSRSKTRFYKEKNNDDEKRKRLGRRLDLVIVVLVVLIVLVYLFMRFVNF